MMASEPGKGPCAGPAGWPSSRSVGMRECMPVLWKFVPGPLPANKSLILRGRKAAIGDLRQPPKVNFPSSDQVCSSAVHFAQSNGLCYQTPTRYLAGTVHSYMAGSADTGNVLQAV